MMDKVYDFSLFRYDIIKNLKVKDLPFVMSEHLYVGSEGLKAEDTIEPAVKHGSISIGFVGLAETLKVLIGEHHGESQKAQELGLEIITLMRSKTEEYLAKSNLNFSLFSTPAEQACSSFRESIVRKHGIIEGVTDREYLTNSFHVPVWYPISIENKLRIEGKYHALCNAGHITHIELDAPPLGNSKAIEDIVHLMMKYDIGYGKINFPVDRCLDCNHTGIIKSGTCPSCGSTEVEKLRVISGYIAPLTQFNSAKLAEVRDRTAHNRVEI